MYAGTRPLFELEEKMHSRRYSALAVTLFFLLPTSILLVGCGPRSADEFIAKAEEAIDAGDQRRAVIYLRNALERDADSIDALIRLGELYSSVDDYRSAERFFRSAVQKGADPTPFRFSWLRALLETRKFREILEQTDPLPDDVDAWKLLSLRAYAQRGLGKLLLAEQSFRDAIDADPDQLIIYTDLAQLLLFMGRRNEADELIAQALARQADFAPALVLRGRREFGEDDPESAKKTLTQAAEFAEAGYDQPVWLAAMAALAEIQLVEGDLTAATATIDAAAARASDEINIRYLRAQLASQQGNFREAQKILQAILADRENYAPAQRLLGSIYALKGELNLAELYLKSAISTDARDQVARSLLAVVRLRQNQPDKALDLIDPDKAELTEGQAGFLALAGQAHLQAGNSDRALELFGAGADQYPGDWRFAVGQALAYLRESRTDEAILLLESLDDTAAPQIRGVTLVSSYVQKGDFEKADAEAHRLAAAYPEEVWAQNLLAGWLMQKRDYAEAAAAFVKSYALEADPQTAVGAAEARARAGIDKPTELLEAWVKGNPDDLPSLHAIGQISLAVGDYARSRDYYERVVAQDAQHVGALNNLAWLYTELQDPRALEIGQRAVKLAPENASILDTLGWAQVQLGQAELGLTTLQTAIELAPDNPEIGLHLALAYAKTGAKDIARELLEALIESDVAFPGRQTAREELARL